MNSYLTFSLTICFFLISCHTNNDKKQVDDFNNQDTLVVEKFHEITNPTLEIGEVIMIEFVLNPYSDFSSNRTIGLNDKIIDSLTKNTSDIPTELGLIPKKFYLDKNSLRYLYDIIINNCNTKVIDDCVSESKLLIYTAIHGRDGRINCVHCGKEPLIEYLNEIISCLELHPNKEKYDKVKYGLSLWLPEPKNTPWRHPIENGGYPYNLGSQY